MCTLINQFASLDKVISILVKVVQSCHSQDFKQFNGKLCLILGQRYMEKTLYTKAYSYFLRGGDVSNSVISMKQVMKSGYHGERDLFVTRLCLEFLVRNYTKPPLAVEAALSVIEAFKDEKKLYEAPLLNFVRILCEAIKLEGDEKTFKMIVGAYK